MDTIKTNIDYNEKILLEFEYDRYGKNLLCSIEQLQKQIIDNLASKIQNNSLKENSFKIFTSLEGAEYFNEVMKNVT